MFNIILVLAVPQLATGLTPTDIRYMKENSIPRPTFDIPRRKVSSVVGAHDGELHVQLGGSGTPGEEGEEGNEILQLSPSNRPRGE